MQNIEYVRYIGAYIGIIMAMLEVIAIILSIFTLTFLNIHREKINKILFYVFQSILWLVLLTGLIYLIAGLIQGFLIYLIK